MHAQLYALTIIISLIELRMDLHLFQAMTFYAFRSVVQYVQHTRSHMLFTFSPSGSRKETAA